MQTFPFVSSFVASAAAKVAMCGVLPVLFVLSSEHSAQAQSYQVADLGVLSGDAKSVACGILTPCGANSFGHAAGTSSNPTAAIATLFANGKAANLNTLGANVSVAIGINGSDQVVGYNFFNSDPSGAHAFLSSNGKMIDIHNPSMFPNGTQAYAINSAGQVVGQGWVSSSSFHAFLYSGGRMTDLDGGFQSSALGINDSGQIVGNGTSSGAFVFSNGRMTSLGIPAGATGSGAFAINSKGDVAGEIFFSNQPGHAAVHSNGTWADLGAFPGASSTRAMGVNTAGQVVGVAFFPSPCYCHPPKPGKHVAFIVSNGAIVDLNTLIPANSGFTLTDALGINDAGQILCNATTSKGEHAVLLTPK